VVLFSESNIYEIKASKKEPDSKSNGMRKMKMCPYLIAPERYNALLFASIKSGQARKKTNGKVANK
jgi:hypothetical protein